MEYDLLRFKRAHQGDYQRALAEIQSGRKRSHWMWYIFPQLRELGYSSTAVYYGIKDLGEAKSFMDDEYLSSHLIEISSALLQLDCSDARYVMGSPDDLKLRSSMTLFSAAAPENDVFQRVLDKFYGSAPDGRTLRLLGIKK